MIKRVILGLVTTGHLFLLHAMNGPIVALKARHNNAISVLYTINNNSGKTVRATFQGGGRIIEPGPAVTIEVKANPIPARMSNSYAVPVCLFDTQFESECPALTVNVLHHVPHGAENNSWTIEIWNENMKKIATWDVRGQTKNESMDIYISIPRDMTQSVIHHKLSSR